jgi:hypothetical protein
MEMIPPEALLDSYPPTMQDAAEALRAIVRRTVPEAIERVRIGWRLIGYDVPVGWRSIYFAYVAPELEHVHLGFEWGVFMRDPGNLLQGAGITKQVRWLTVSSRAEIDEAAYSALVLEAVRVTALTRSERFGLALEREEPAPEG